MAERVKGGYFAIVPPQAAAKTLRKKPVEKPPVDKGRLAAKGDWNNGLPFQCLLGALLLASLNAIHFAGDQTIQMYGKY